MAIPKVAKVGDRVRFQCRTSDGQIEAPEEGVLHRHLPRALDFDWEINGGIGLIRSDEILEIIEPAPVAPMVYLAGPMSGYPEFNAPAFREAAAALRAYDGWTVLSPVELDEESGFDHTAEETVPSEEEYHGFLRRDLQRMLGDGVEKIVVLPGWEKSRGAALEVEVGRRLGMEILAYPTLAPVKEPSAWRPASDETILEEAQRIVGGDRGDDYGHPRDDFARTAGAWNALFGWEVTPRQVALAMIVVKLSRLQETPGKRDSVTDMAGYARTYEMVAEKEGESLR